MSDFKLSNKIKFVNKTTWDTRALRRFVYAGLKAEVGAWGHYWIEIYVLRPHPKAVGYGWYGVRAMQIGVPNYTYDVNEIPVEELRRMARTLAHEVKHNDNEHHRDMLKSYELEVPWFEELIASGFSVGRKVMKPKKTSYELRHKMYEHAQKMFSKYYARSKRDQKLVQKWRRTMEYYERLLDEIKAAESS